MRQLNNKQFDTKEGASASHSELSHPQLAPSVSQKDENMTYNQAKKTNNIVDYVFNLAKTDKKMTAKETATFHLFNPNGNYRLCKDWGFEAASKGSFPMGLFAGQWHYEKLLKLTDMKKPRWWFVNYHVNALYEDAVQWAEMVKDVENRTDEEKEYAKSFIKGGK
tara:strand:- start:2457 stop:2951 length:495 start_codon:yes stop_codon:yes gene_type:complete